jgi:hypothetical protein
MERLPLSVGYAFLLRAANGTGQAPAEPDTENSVMLNHSGRLISIRKETGPQGVCPGRQREATRPAI